MIRWHSNAFLRIHLFPSFRPLTLNDDYYSYRPWASVRLPVMEFLTRGHQSLLCSGLWPPFTYP